MFSIARCRNLEQAYENRRNKHTKHILDNTRCVMNEMRVIDKEKCVMRFWTMNFLRRLDATQRGLSGSFPNHLCSHVRHGMTSIQLSPHSCKQKCAIRTHPLVLPKYRIVLQIAHAHHSKHDDVCALLMYLMVKS